MEFDKLIIGTARFGVTLTQEQCFAQLDRFAEVGGTTIDTATSYGEQVAGVSTAELVVGAWLRKNPTAQMRLISKCCMHSQAQPQVSRVRPECVSEDMAQSLDALGVESIDVMMYHRDDPTVAVGELVGAMADEISAGRVGAWGVSNWSVARVSEANAYARAHGLPEAVASEVQWSLPTLRPGDQLLPGDELTWMSDEEYGAYRNLDLAILAYMSNAKGFVYFYQKMLSEGRSFADCYNLMSPREAKTLRVFDNEVSRERAQRAVELAAQLGCTPSQLALAYVLNAQLRSSIIVGHNQLWEIDDNMASSRIALTPEQVAYLSAGSLDCRLAS